MFPSSGACHQVDRGPGHGPEVPTDGRALLTVATRQHFSPGIMKTTDFGSFQTLLPPPPPRPDPLPGFPLLPELGQGRPRGLPTSCGPPLSSPHDQAHRSFVPTSFPAPLKSRRAAGGARVLGSYPSSAADQPCDPGGIP